MSVSDEPISVSRTASGRTTNSSAAAMPSVNALKVDALNSAPISSITVSSARRSMSSVKSSTARAM